MKNKKIKSFLKEIGKTMHVQVFIPIQTVFLRRFCRQNEKAFLFLNYSALPCCSFPS